MKIRLIVLTLAIFVTGACGALSSGPVKQVAKGDELAFYDFTNPGTFEEGMYGNNTARLQISDGLYNIQLSSGDSTLYYGQWGDTLRDVVVEVDATQTSSDLNSTYGIMCRMRGAVGQAIKANPNAVPQPTDIPGTDNIIASKNTDATAEATSDATAEATAESTAEATLEATETITAEPTAEVTPQAGATASTSDNTANNGDGYLFMVQGNGRYAILRSQGHKITPLVNWTSSDSVNQGAAQNQIRAICMGNYLALYVNGHFVADTTDDLYSQGQVGLVGASAGRTGMTVNFDNLTVFQAKAG